MRRNCRVSKLERITKEEIRRRMDVERKVTEYIEMRHLKWDFNN